GHCVCIPRVVVDTIVFPDALRFPHYHGDSSYTLKATRSGFRAYILGDAWVTHPGIIKSKLEDFTDLGKTPAIRAFQDVFLHKKSLYFLPTQFHYNAEKYGKLKGTVLLCLKLVRWIPRLIWLKLSYRSQ
ncbi:MAG: glycosyltransferase family 2 protein, partial [Cyanobacteria bacterium Co-bin13]|nr:glycosyltransferase family 2 protein [Cyanobacteria bacterium Co-bin13]